MINRFSDKVLTMGNYEYIYAPHLNPKRYSVSQSGKIQLHRLLMEVRLRRKLHSGEDVHHINGNSLDNRWDNLRVLSKGEHTRLHHKGSVRSKETKKRISKAQSGKNNSMYGYKRTREQKKKHSEMMKSYWQKIKLASNSNDTKV